MGAAEITGKGPSLHVSTEQDFLDTLSRRHGEDRPAGVSAQAPVPHGQEDQGVAKYVLLQAVAQHHVVHFSSSLRSLHDRHFRLGSFFGSSSSHSDVMRMAAPSLPGNRCL